MSKLFSLRSAEKTSSSPARTSDVASRRRIYKIVGIGASVIVVLVGIGAGIVYGYEAAYANRVFPGVQLSDQRIGGKSLPDVQAIFAQLDQDVQQREFVFFAGDHQAKISAMPVAADPDLARPILTIDWPRMTQDAMQYGRRGPLTQQLWDRLRGQLVGVRLSVRYTLDRDELYRTLRENFSADEQPALNAGLQLENGTFIVTPERDGIGFSYAAAINEFNRQAARLTFAPIALHLEQQQPTIVRSETASALPQAQRLLELKTIQITADKKTWDVPKDVLVGWLGFTRDTDNTVVVGINPDQFALFIEPIASEVALEPKSAKFTLENGRVVEFVPSQTGIKLDVDATRAQFENALREVPADASAPLIVAAVVSTADPAIGIQDVNNLGIKELLGTGTSNFKGSPVNRRHNIATGAAALNGILIAPNEEFSLIDALGEIDGENGYLQELVIKGNRTVPEYGGGLCQVGTTTFRAALRSGLPIVERRNHSYRVSYYEPAGMDATIYDPSPDFKFLNDTGHHILFVTRQEGDDLIFDFYGTSDGRKVEITPDPPRIYNVTSAGPVKYIETEDLKPGEKKKIESAHPGADTYFKYTVTYADGRVFEKEFTSHYVAWPEVWMIGKELASTPEDGSTSELPPDTSINTNQSVESPTPPVTPAP